jgi:hypothetical protein
VSAAGVLALAAVSALVACTVPNPSYRTGWPVDAGADGDGSRPDVPLADVLEELDPADAEPAGDASPMPPDPPPRLVGYWKLDEAAGSTMALDSSGSGNHGWLESLDSTQARVAGHRGSAVRFAAGESGDAGIRVPLSPSLAGLREFTVAAWVNHSAVPVGQNASVVSRQIAATTWEVFNLNTSGDELTVYACTDQQPYPRVRVPGAAPFERWVHVAATFDGAQLRLYRDGLEIGSAALTRPLPTADNPLYIGTNKNPTRNDVFAGLIDEVVLYSAALPATSLRALMDGSDPASL